MRTLYAIARTNVYRVVYNLSVTKWLPVHFPWQPHAQPWALLNEGKTAQLKPTITPAELKGLEQKLAKALREIQRVMKPGVRP
ncbi:hypothetical protein [Pseudomonas sp. B28(2017)]|uniref:hypothetical protein n=1 Tax=Pseudomonas sp. B28(2017) TaxID=1981730 RepID=UPI0011798E43|nr:hypothetical protein [Pseudomonas sp. B28(2017)]